MSSRATPDKDPSVKYVTEYHQDHNSDRATSSTSLTKDSDVILRIPHERLGTCPITMSYLTDSSIFFIKQHSNVVRL